MGASWRRVLAKAVLTKAPMGKGLLTEDGAVREMAASLQRAHCMESLEHILQ